ncbi:serine endoprotease DegP (Protease Do), periplasmic [Photobacterium leiognathi lrivu.4.1]|uniref:Serine endoprotease DegP (Protease Do), periplasmic n=1 Tax=Photobacterium leiognathi lrivu.4.1 TaxID=1248232 RepID=V5F5B0_PHOLE|nr:serine endoprotease DegP (Protease Do), periplasmic [Photobacterium leiognathi lrivu.4.1]
MIKKSVFTIGALALCVSSILSPLTANAALPTTVNNQLLPSLAPMLEHVTPAVVSIAVEGKHVSKQRLPDNFHYFFGPNSPLEQIQERPFKSLGSGVIIDAKKGYIITNHHVIDDANTITVQLSDGREEKAKLIGSDAMSDIALLQLDNPKNLTEIKLANSDKLRIGDFAVAIGNPFGLGQTVTSGIVSALGRSGLNIENFENFIQTDAAINSGNSGGALVNLNGELIGINTAIVGPNGGNVGIGLAIPSNMVKNLTDQILEFGQVKRGVLGVQGRELTAELAKTFGYSTNHGAFVNQVIPDSAAEKAGLKAGDIITDINGQPIRTFSELRAKIATMGAGKKLTLSVIRDGKKQSVNVTLKASSENKINADNLHPNLTGAVFTNTTATDKVKGVKVSKLDERSIAARYGLQKGDIIIGLNRLKINNLGELRKALEEKPSVLAMEIQRNGQTLYLIIR